MTLEHLDGSYKVEPGDGQSRDSYLREHGVVSFLVVNPKVRRRCACTCPPPPFPLLPGPSQGGPLWLQRGSQLHLRFCDGRVLFFDDNENRFSAPLIQ